MRNKRNTLASDATVVVRGMMMGGADVIPGVSGGTVALIVGIYERLVTAISHVDRSLFEYVRQRQWRQAAEHIDLRFLITLGLGVVGGIVTVGSQMEHLLTNPTLRSLTLAAFFGMILASSVIVVRMISPESRSHGALLLLLTLVSGASAYWLTSLGHLSADATPVYVFICGVVAICAMILPGVSGAYLLLILGLYPHLTGILERLRGGEVTFADVTTVAIFGTGCLFGLTSFSKVLRWMLAKWRRPTLAVLCGMMIGALHKIWPFQQDLTPDEVKLKHKHFEPMWPEVVDWQVLACMLVGIIAMLVVLLVERLANRRSPT